MRPIQHGIPSYSHTLLKRHTNNSAVLLRPGCSGQQDHGQNRADSSVRQVGCQIRLHRERRSSLYLQDEQRRSHVQTRQGRHLQTTGRVDRGKLL